MDEDWVLYFTTTFTFAVIFSLCYVRYVYTFFERNKIQPPAPPTFPFGNIYDVLFQKTPMFMQLWKFYNRFKRKKCAMGGFYIFLKPAVLMMDPERTQIVTSRARNRYFLDVDDNLIDVFPGGMLPKICENLQRMWPRLVSKLHDEEVNFSQLMYRDYVEMAVRELFDVELSRGAEARDGTWGLLKKIIALRYPNLIGDDKGGEGIFRELTRTRDDVKKDGIAQELRKSGLSSDETKNFIRCVVDNMIKANRLVLFALFELSDNEEIQDELRGEITRFGKNRSPGNYYDELGGLTYLETVICETLRKYPLDPFVCKICKEEYVDNKIHVMKDTLVFVSTFGVHHDGQHYTNPELFDPDRFSEENLRFIDLTKYLPFGCKKENSFDVLYVRLLMKISLVELLSRFKFSLGKKSPKSVQFDEGVFGSLKMKEDVWLRIDKL